MKTKKFLIYGILGWALEIIWTSVWNALNGDLKLTGTTYGWMFIIYGLAIYLEKVHERIRKLPWYERGIIWTIIIYTIEYISGWILRAILGICPWDYTGQTLSINGLIRLDFAPAWFVAGLIFEQAHDIISHLFVYYENSIRNK